MSRSKPKEWPTHSKSAEPAGTNQNAPTDTVAEISMKDFLDFLKISYQVHEAIDNPSVDITEKTSVDWKKITSDALIHRLKEREALINKEKHGKLKSVSLEKTTGANSPLKATRESGTHTDSEVPIKNRHRQKIEERFLGTSSSCETLNESTVQPEMFSSSLSLDDKSHVDRGKRAPLSRKKFSKKDNSVNSETSRSLDSADEPARMIKKKLTEVLQEGILDSVIPYLMPHQAMTQENLQPHVRKPSLQDIKKPSGGSVENNEKLQSVANGKDKFDSKRKTLIRNDVEKYERKDTEVIIHVCDEIKNLKKDFKCPQKLLVSQMGYFAEVTSGQKLEDMDISVHCDVTIFEWLMKWVQKDKNEQNWPVLDSSIVIPVLMSSAFLQMQSLQDHCLQYCKRHINDIVLYSPNLGCINDSVLTRLVSLFSNSEIESIVDKKDKIQSKSYCKLILALSQPEPQPQRGHFSSLATLYRCSKCLKLLLKNLSSSVSCVASNMKINWNGTIHSTHVYDSSWNLTDYIKDLKTELKSWRRVYWRLWSNCHFLFCQTCEEYFPVNQRSWCRYHTEPVQYFISDNHKPTHSGIGRYPCCKERSFRFEIVNKTSGCQYRDHLVSSKTSTDVEILRLCDLYAGLTRENPPPFVPLDKKRSSKATSDESGSRKLAWKDSFWWDGMQLVPPVQATGLLHKIWDTVVKKDELRKEYKGQKSFTAKYLPQQPSSQDASSVSDISDDSSTCSTADNSEESYHHSAKMTSKSKSSTSSYCITSRNDCNRFWLAKLSTRCNQDNQREFEERALRQIESLLAKKLSGESFRSSGSRSTHQVMPAGGIYVKLEQEWREAYCFSHGCPGSAIKARGSSSCVNVHKRSKSRGHR